MTREKTESTITPDVATAKLTRLGDYLQTSAGSGDNVIRRGFQEYDWGDMADFVIRVPLDIWETADLENLDRILSDIEYVGRVELSETTISGPHVQTDDAYVGRPDADDEGGAIFTKDQPEKIYLKNLPKKGESGGKEVDAADELDKKSEWEILIAKIQKLLGEGFLRAKPSTSLKRAYSRKWYLKNKAKLAAKRKKLKSATERKRKEVMARQRKTKFSKPQTKHPASKNHTNETKLKTSFKDYMEKNR